MEYRFTLRINRASMVDVLNAVNELGYDNATISRNKGYITISFIVESNNSCIEEVKDRIAGLKSQMGDNVEILQKMVRE